MKNWKLALIAVMLPVLAAARPQEVKHAPTIEQCAADLNLWTSQIEGWPNPTQEQLREGNKRLTVNEMQGRILSLSDCAEAHPILNTSKVGVMPATTSLLVFYDQEVESRLFNFIERHGMLKKFTEEDESGKR